MQAGRRGDHRRAGPAARRLAQGADRNRQRPTSAPPPKPASRTSSSSSSPPATASPATPSSGSSTSSASRPATGCAATRRSRKRKMFYICSLSTKVIIYKGMLTTEQLFHYYPRPRRAGLHEPPGDGPLAVLDEHVPLVGPRPADAVHEPQRRDQHAARQHELDAGPRRASSRASCSATSCRSCSRSPSPIAATRARSTTCWNSCS